MMKELSLPDEMMKELKVVDEMMKVLKVADEMMKELKLADEVIAADERIQTVMKLHQDPPRRLMKEFK